MTKELAQEIDPPIEEEKQEQKEESQESQTEKQEEKPEENQDSKEGEKKKQDFVPHKAFHEERERRKQLQSELARLQSDQAQQRQVLEQRFAQMQAAWQQQNAPKAPEYETDPVGNIKFSVEQAQAELAAIKQHQEQEYRRQYDEFQKAQYANRIVGEVSRAESEYSKENPDYPDAVKHLKSLRAQQLEALGMDQPSIMAYVQNEAFQIAEAALQRGQNPADVAFRMAVASGWKKQEARPQAETKIETLQKGVKAAQSLGSGGNPTGKLTVDAVAEMSDDEFNEFMKSGGWNKLG